MTWVALASLAGSGTAESPQKNKTNSILTSWYTHSNKQYEIKQNKLKKIKVYFF